MEPDRTLVYLLRRGAQRRGMGRRAWGRGPAVVERKEERARIDVLQSEAVDVRELVVLVPGADGEDHLARQRVVHLGVALAGTSVKSVVTPAVSTSSVSRMMKSSSVGKLLVPLFTWWLPFFSREY